MRVVDPRLYKPQKKKLPKRKPKLHKVVIPIVLIAVALTAFWLYPRPQESSQAPSDQGKSSADDKTVNKPKSYSTLKTFTPEQFRDLYKTFAFPNTQKISENTPITGSEALDSRIKSLAGARGYEIRSAPIVDNFVDVDPTIKLQQKAYEGWSELSSNASKDNVGLKIIAGYRSADDQRTIFLSRLSNQYNPSDAQISNVLVTTAPPGYSRHHTGYTIDLSCNSAPYARFETTQCFTWLSQNNYENAKKAGWIPSYPLGATNQGPEPESWEYVWVGKDSLYQ